MKLVVAPTYLASTVLLTSLLSVQMATAQIVPDATLPVNSQVVPGCTDCTITGGTLRGSTLFHSFGQFSVPTGGSAWFNSEAQVRNIVTRVTGGAVSTIDGLLRTNGTTGLFLLNPNGVIFGANARLDVAGSLVVSTASSLILPDGSEFSAVNPQAPPLLEVNLTPGLQYGASNPGATITNLGQLQTGQDLTLRADQLNIQGTLQAGGNLSLLAQTSVQLSDTAAQPLQLTAGNALLVDGPQQLTIDALNNPASQLQAVGNLTLRSNGALTSTARLLSQQGDLAVTGNQIALQGQIQAGRDFALLAQTTAQLSDTATQPLQITAGRNLSVTGTQQLTLDALTNPASQLQATNNLTLQTNGALASAARLLAQQGNVSVSGNQLAVQGQIRAGQNIALVAQTAALLNDTATQPLQINAANQLLIVGPQQLAINALNHPASQLQTGGNLTLRSNNPVSSNARFDVAGDLRIEGMNGALGNLTSPDGLVLQTNGSVSFGNYTGNSLHILAGGNVTTGNITILGASVNPATALSRTVTLSDGTSVAIDGSAEPTVDIQAGRLNPNARIVINGRINNTSGSATGSGTVILTNNLSPDRINAINNSIVRVEDIQASGDIYLDSQGSLQANGVLDTIANNANAGRISVLANGEIQTRDNIRSEVLTGTGNAGDIKILSHLSSVNTSLSDIISRSAAGSAGDITIRAANNLFVGNVTASSVNNNPNGATPTISMTSDQGSVNLDNATVRMTNPGTARVGTISIDAEQAINFTNSQIDSQGVAGVVRVGSDRTDQVRIRNSTLQTATLPVNNPTTLDPGNLSIRAGNIHLDNATILATTRSAAQPSRIALDARNALTISDGSRISSAITAGNGNANAAEDNRAIFLRGNTIRISEFSTIDTETNGVGPGGGITLITNAPGSITDPSLVIDQSQINSFTNSLATTGTGGNITLSSDSVSITDASRLSATTVGVAKGGDINVFSANDRGSIWVNHTSTISTAIPDDLQGALDEGDGGSITLSSGAIILGGGSTIDASALGNGRGGDVFLNATVGDVDIRESQILTNVGNANTFGNQFDLPEGGNITVSAQQDIRLDDASLQANVLANAQGNGGTIDLFGRSLILNNSRIQTQSDGNPAGPSPMAQAQAGQITVNVLDSVSLFNNSQLNAQSSRAANAGDIQITAPNFVQLNRSQISTQATGSGSSGNIDIATRDLRLEDGSLISASNRSASAQVGLTFGNIRFRGLNRLLVDNSQITASTDSGQAGSLIVNQGQAPVELAQVQNGSRIELSARSGSAGKISLNVTNLEVSNQASISTSSKSGRGGDIELMGLNQLDINNSLISASTVTGQAGDVNVNVAGGTVRIWGENSGLSASATGAKGVAGDVNLLVNRLRIWDGGVISASATSGRAGSVTINASESVRISDRGSGLFVRATETNGIAGNLSLRTGQLTIADNAEVSVSSPFGQAGNLFIASQNILLDRGTIKAETGASAADGSSTGNIRLQISDLLVLKNESLISAQAFNTATGGNITIDARYIFAFLPTGPNGSDIIANAALGNGGRINVNALALFGIEFRFQRTPFNDITAQSSGGSDGRVSLDTLNIDPSRGFKSLPVALTDPSQHIVQTCSPAGQGTSRSGRFVSTGRGGLATSPDDAFNGSQTLTNLVPLLPSQGGAISAIPTPLPDPDEEIVEAQAIHVDRDGSVYLIARPGYGATQAPWQTVQCPPASYLSN